VRRTIGSAAMWTSVAGAVAVLAGQTQGPIRSGAETVAVYATVADATGRLVTDLTRDDFEVLDNGKPQPLTIFTSDTQPITIVVMLDRSESMRANFRLVEAAADEFVRRLLPGDRARLGSFATRIQVDPRDFTGDRAELTEILRTELQPAGPTPLWNAIGVGITALARQDGRRVVLVFTDGVDRPFNGSSRNLSLRDVTRRAEAENVMVYGIGLAIRMSFPGRGGRGYGGGFGGYGGGGGRGGMRTIEQGPDPGLAKLSAESGGGYFELTTTNDLGSTFARVADELHRQYGLGFVPAKLDGKRHDLEVRVKRPGLVARARRSYIAPRQPPRSSP
jgi:Ca-activated chloride channel family protein